MLNDQSKYESAIAERSKYVDAIIQSTSQKKIVVAGPGTGKTYLFKKIVECLDSSLTLTFINSLVEDLALELYGLSDVRTLHGFARSILRKLTNRDIKISPFLPLIIAEDAKIMLDRDIDFNHIFHNRLESSQDIAFYKKRHQYYDYYGYSDMIFAAVLYFEKYESRIPIYDQILIDEFQDFNLLEVSLIDLLGTKNNILIAGDDDQALYEFKSASTEHIRNRYDKDNEEYEPFTLPYCSRCTKVVVAATNDIINHAIQDGRLDGRISKSYLYFDCPNKDEVSSIHNKIGFTKIFDSQIPWFIEKQISDYANLVKKDFSVLVITPYKRQSQSLAKSLNAKGFNNIDCAMKKEEEVSVLDGLKILLDNIKDNLGWRIISNFLLSTDELSALVKETDLHPGKNISELLDQDITKDVKSVVKLLKKIRSDKSISDEEMDVVISKINLDPTNILHGHLNTELNKFPVGKGNPALRKVPIKITTIQSSKGLSGELVFITHFDDRYYLGDAENISDREICNLLVAVTRTRNKLFLISTSDIEPKFLNWIDKERIETIKMY